MKIEFEQEDIQKLAEKVVVLLKPFISAPSMEAINEIMDVKSVADYLRVDVSWVYKQVQFKSIPHFHAGKYPRFKRSEIDAWVREQSTAATRSPYPRLVKHHSCLTSISRYHQLRIVK